MNRRARDRADLLQQAIDRLEQRVADLTDRLEAGTLAQGGRHAHLLGLLRVVQADEQHLRERLLDARADPSYEAAFDEPEPLISIVLATFDSHQTLRERAIPSILAQTYENFELIVMGDAAVPECEQAVL